MVRFDFLGWGSSDKPSGYPYTADNQTLDLAAVTDAVSDRLGQDQTGSMHPARRASADCGTGAGRSPSASGRHQRDRRGRLKPAFVVGLKLGDSELGLVNEEATDLSAPQRILLSVDVDDVNALLHHVDAAGGRVLGPPTDMPWGQRVAHVHDPDGNMINLTQSL